MLTDDQRYAAVRSRDPRFDGWFVTAVRTTGIYCRPSCPALTPRRDNVEFHPTAAAAQRHGFRACKRCRPDATPGSPEWRQRDDVVARAMRLIADGIVDRDGVGGLCARLGYSERQLRRMLVDEVGAGPLALARAQRAQAARVLIETTSMPLTEIAFASGFGSVRQFNDTVREVFAASPSSLRAERHEPAGRGAALSLRLPARTPFAGREVLAFLGARAIAGVESWDGEEYRRTLRLPHGHGVVALVAAADHVRASLRVEDLADVQAAVQRCRRLLDLDADPGAVDERLAADPRLADLVRRCPGRRSAGSVEGSEMLVRGVVGQQISIGAARTVTTALAALAGARLTAPDGALTHHFPTAEEIAALGEGGERPPVGMPRARWETLVGACRAVAEGRVRVDPGSDWAESRAQLLAQRGIGPWTAEYVAMRGLGDPDVFLHPDGGVRSAWHRLTGEDAAAAHTGREAWSPWGSYVTHHLWASLHEPAPGGLAAAERHRSTAPHDERATPPGRSRNERP